MQKNIFVLIPAYEPTEKLIELSKELKKHNLNIIVINDGSNSDYNKIFEKTKKYALVLQHEINKGKGAAIKTGLQYINDNNKDYIVATVDCDGQHSVKDTLRLIEYSKLHHNELVLGKRLRNKKIPLRSRIGNGITRFIYKITTGLDVYDTQTGLRTFTDKLVPTMLNIKGERFEYEMNVLLECARNNIKIKEIDIETIYINNNSGSHFNPLKDSFEIYKEIFKFLSSSFICFIIDYLLYSVLIIFTNKITLSNIFSRIISATINFSLNKNIVFKNKDKCYKQIIKYTVLAIFVLIVNTLILNLLINYIFINKFLAKIIVEIFLLILSWIVQKKIIFKK